MAECGEPTLAIHDASLQVNAAGGGVLLYCCLVWFICISQPFAGYSHRLYKARRADSFGQKAWVSLGWGRRCLRKARMLQLRTKEAGAGDSRSVWVSIARDDSARRKGQLSIGWDRSLGTCETSPNRELKVCSSVLGTDPRARPSVF